MAKIAIIDDDPDIVEAATLLLESNNYNVVSASDVEEGLSLIENEDPDLILLDVMMNEPDDGFYMANKLRKKGCEKPILLLTSVSMVTGYSYDKGSALPVNEFLEKPISPDLLLEKVNYYLSGSGGE